MAGRLRYGAEKEAQIVPASQRSVGELTANDTRRVKLGAKCQCSEYHFSDPTSDLMFTLDIGAGGVTFDTDVFSVDNVVCTPLCTTQSGARSSGNFDQTYFSLNGGLQLGYNFARHAPTGTPMVTIFIGADVHMMFADAVDSALLAALYGESSGFDTVYLIPITAGLRLNIP